MMSNFNAQVRPAHFADDQWYSADPEQLEADVRNYLADASGVVEPEDVIGLVAPHAGYFFSGHVAGAGFASLSSGLFETVVLIGPDHRGVTRGKLSTLKVEAWRTPLGDMPVDWEMVEAIKSNIGLKLLDRDAEHSLEVELPFLQVALGSFGLVPLIMGSQTPAECQRLGRAVGQAIQARQEATGKQSLLVASSDLSHFFDDDTARRLDQKTLEFVLELDAEGLIEYVESGRQRGDPLACGAGPIAAIIHAAKALGATQAHLIKYATSADVYPSKDRVVGYAAVVISK